MTVVLCVLYDRGRTQPCNIVATLYKHALPQTLPHHLYICYGFFADLLFKNFVFYSYIGVPWHTAITTLTVEDCNKWLKSYHFLPEHLHERRQTPSSRWRIGPYGRVRSRRDLLGGPRIGGPCHLLRGAGRTETPPPRPGGAVLHAREGIEHVGGRSAPGPAERRKHRRGFGGHGEAAGTDSTTQEPELGRLCFYDRSRRGFIAGIKVGFLLLMCVFVNVGFPAFL